MITSALGLSRRWHKSWCRGKQSGPSTALHCQEQRARSASPEQPELRPPAVWELSAPTSQSSFQSIQPLVEVSFKAKHERGLLKRSADLEHLEFLKHNHCLCLEIVAFIRTFRLAYLGLLSSASSAVSFIIIKLCLFTCQYYYKAIIFNNYNNAAGLKSQILRDLLHPLQKAPTMSYE